MSSVPGLEVDALGGAGLSARHRRVHDGHAAALSELEESTITNMSELEESTVVGDSKSVLKAAQGYLDEKLVITY